MQPIDQSEQKLSLRNQDFLFRLLLPMQSRFHHHQRDALFG
jgi:hypothetical protein